MPKRAKDSRQATPVSEETPFDLSYVHSLQLMLPEGAKSQLVMVGCGGTGSWLAPAVARVARLMMERFGKKVEVTFIDHDDVEEKNIYRQNFCAAEIGMNKADALALRYGTAWGVEITAISKKLTEDDGSEIHGATVIGCVDNAAARKAIHHIRYAAWLDCGNSKNSGQVLLGVERDSWNKGFDEKGALGLPGYCGWLPSPAVQHPELVKASPPAPLQKLERGVDDLSCAEIALLDAQGLSINQRMAAEAADYLVRMLITKDLRKYATYIDLESGTTRSKYITEEAVRGMAGRK